MQRIFVLTITFLQLFTLNAQVFKWASAYGKASYDGGHSITLDKLGNVYSTGVFFDTIDFDPGPDVYNLYSPYGLDLYVSKLDNNGNLIWALSIGGIYSDQPNSITTDEENNIIITGAFSGIVDFDPGPGVFNLTGFPFYDIFILKLDAEGNFINAVRIGNISTPSDIGMGVDIDTSGNVYVTGYFELITDFDPGPGIHTLTSNGERDIFILKLDENLNFIWALNFGSIEFGDSGYSIFIDNSQNVLVTGYFTGTVDFDPGPDVYELTTHGLIYNDDIFILKLDVDGNFIMARSMGGDSYDVGYSIYSDQEDNIFVCGNFKDTADFNPGPDVYNLICTNYYEDFFVLKLTSEGEFAWAKAFGGESGDDAYALSIDDSGFVYITGGYNKTVDFDPGPDVYELVSDGYSNVYILKLNNDGEFIWVKEFEGGDDEYGRDIYLDNTGGIYLTGTFSETVDFDPDTGVYELSEYVEDGVATHTDIFIMKLGTCQMVNIQPTDQNINEGENGMFISYSFDPLAIYQWQENSGMGFIDLTDGGIYSGTNNDTLLISDPPLSFSGYTYRCNLNHQPCEDTSNVALLIIEKGNEIYDPVIKPLYVYPNPSNGVFTVEGIGELLVYNSLGVLIYSSSLKEINSTIHLDNQPQGIYLLQIQDGNAVYTSKVLIQ